MASIGIVSIIIIGIGGSRIVRKVKYNRIYKNKTKALKSLTSTIDETYTPLRKWNSTNPDLSDYEFFMEVITEINDIKSNLRSIEMKRLAASVMVDVTEFKTYLSELKKLSKTLPSNGYKNYKKGVYETIYLYLRKTNTHLKELLKQTTSL